MGLVPEGRKLYIAVVRGVTGDVYLRREMHVTVIGARVRLVGGPERTECLVELTNEELEKLTNDRHVLGTPYPVQDGIFHDPVINEADVVISAFGGRWEVTELGLREKQWPR